MFWSMLDANMYVYACVHGCTCAYICVFTCAHLCVRVVFSIVIYSAPLNFMQMPKHLNSLKIHD